MAVIITPEKIQLETGYKWIESVNALFGDNDEN